MKPGGFLAGILFAHSTREDWTVKKVNQQSRASSYNKGSKAAQQPRGAPRPHHQLEDRHPVVARLVRESADVLVRAREAAESLGDDIEHCGLPKSPAGGGSRGENRRGRMEGSAKKEK